jgi:hypothetical protein
MNIVFLMKYLLLWIQGLNKTQTLVYMHSSLDVQQFSTKQRKGHAIKSVTVLILIYGAVRDQWRHSVLK